jgi:hypothetical protein
MTTTKPATVIGALEVFERALVDLHGCEHPDLWPDLSADIATARAAVLALFAAATRRAEEAARAQPESEWHEDVGPVLWWAFPVQEPPYVGTPLDSDWPGYHTHWTPIAIPADPRT